MTYLLLFFEFFKTGLFAVGGGAATIPFLMEMTNRYDWFTKSELLNMIAVSESTPGPIGINMATYAGFHTGGIFGAVLATFALVLPAFIIMTFIARLFARYKDNQTVQSVFTGIRPAVAAMIASAAWSVINVTMFAVKNDHVHLLIAPAILCVLLLVGMNLKWCRKFHPAVWIGIGALAGIILRL